MKYAEMLDNIIKKCGLSLRQITKRCIDMNYEITPSYISQLKNGKLPPPSEEISKTLAYVCGEKEPMRLVFQGYLEKAPEMIKEYILKSSSLNKQLLQFLSQEENQQLSENFSDYLNHLDIITSLDLSIKYMNSKNESNITSFLQEMNTLSGAVQKSENENAETSYFFLRDSSMEPLISMNAHITITPTKKELLKSKDVVAFHPNNSKTPLLRRYYEQNNNIILVPENKEYDIFFCKDIEEYNYLGKVISYKMNF